MRAWAGPWMAVLLMVQWAGGMGACLAAKAWDPARVVCHGGTKPEHTPDPAPLARCPLCAPLPPSLLPPPPAIPTPRPVVVMPGAPRPALTEAPSAVTLWPHQPRAPPQHA